jgi:hypothetical protein
MFFLYIILSKRVVSATTDANSYSGIDINYYGVTPADTPTPDGVDIGIPKVYDAGVVRNATQLEIDGFPALEAQLENLQQRDLAVSLFNSPEFTAKVLKAVTLLTMDELNLLREQIIGVQTFTFDPSSMTNNTGTSSATINVPGAAFGDSVDVTAPYTLQGVYAQGYVVNSNTVAVRLFNASGGTINLASGTWKVVVRRHQELPQRTSTQVKNAVLNKITTGEAD